MFWFYLAYFALAGGQNLSARAYSTLIFRGKYQRKIKEKNAISKTKEKKIETYIDICKQNRRKGELQNFRTESLFK